MTASPIAKLLPETGAFHFVWTDYSPVYCLRTGEAVYGYFQGKNTRTVKKISNVMHIFSAGQLATAFHMSFTEADGYFISDCYEQP
jgi:hypothetical protein